MARSGGEGVAFGVEAGVDAPRREVLVDPPSGGRTMTGSRVRLLNLRPDSVHWNPQGVDSSGSRARPIVLIHNAAMVQVVPARVEWLDALVEGDDVFTDRFGISVVEGGVGFPEALPRRSRRCAGSPRTSGAPSSSSTSPMARSSASAGGRADRRRARSNWAMPLLPLGRAAVWPGRRPGAPRSCAAPVSRW